MRRKHKQVARHGGTLLREAMSCSAPSSMFRVSHLDLDSTFT